MEKCAIFLDICNVYNFRSERDLRSYEVSKLKQLQTKPRKNSEAPTGFEPMTSAIPVLRSTD